MARRSGGNPRIKILADADQVDKAARQGERALGRFSDAAQKESRAVERANDRSSRSFGKFGGSVTKEGKSVARNVAGVAAGFTSVAGTISTLRESSETVINLAKDTSLLARTMGIEREEASKWVQTAKLRGVAAQQLNMGFVSLARNTEAATAASGKQRDAFRALGVSQKELRDSDTSELLSKISDGFAEMPDGAQKAALAQQLFGRQARTLLGLLNGGSSALSENLGLVEKYGATLDDAGVNKAMETVEAQRKLSLAWDGIKIQLGQELVPLLADGADKMTEFVSGFRKGEGAGGEFRDALKKVHDAGAPVVEFLKDHPGLIKTAVAAWGAYKVAGIVGNAASRVSMFRRMFQGGTAVAASAGAVDGRAYWAAFNASGRPRPGGAAGPGGRSGGAPGAIVAPAPKPTRFGPGTLTGGLVATAGLTVGAEQLIRSASGNGNIFQQDGPDVGLLQRVVGRSDADPSKTIERMEAKLRALAAAGNTDGMRKLAKNLRDIKQEFSGSTKGDTLLKFAKDLDELAKQGEETKDTLKRTNRETRRSFRDLADDGEVSIKDIRGAVRSNMRMIRERLDVDSAEGQQAMSRNFKGAMQAVRRSMKDGTTSTREGLAEIRKLMRENLALYGIEGKAADRYMNGQDTITGKNLNAPLVNKNRGGYLVGRGLRGMDNIPVLAAAGEAFLTGDDQAQIEADTYPGYLDDLFGQMQRRPHYMNRGGRLGGDGVSISQFARGGIVPVPGFPGERASTSILPKIAQIRKRFPGLVLTDAFGSGHSSPGHTVHGTAADFAGPDAVMDAAVRMLVAQGYKVLYDGRFGSTAWPGHGPSSVAGDNAHLHVEFGGAGGGGPIKGGGSLKDVKAPRWKGPGGPMGAIGKKALSLAARAANEKLASVAGSAGGGGTFDSGTAAPGDADVAKAFRRAIRKAGASPIEQLALFMAGIVESQMQNLPGGDRDSVGALQQRTPWGSYESRRNPYESALRFLSRARAKRPWGGSAGQLAQAVQVSAYPERYDQVRAQAMRYMNRGGRVGFSRGGRNGVKTFGGITAGSTPKPTKKRAAAAQKVAASLHPVGFGQQMGLSIAMGADNVARGNVGLGYIQQISANRKLLGRVNNQLRQRGLTVGQRVALLNRRTELTETIAQLEGEFREAVTPVAAEEAGIAGAESPGTLPMDIQRDIALAGLTRDDSSDDIAAYTQARDILRGRLTSAQAAGDDASIIDVANSLVSIESTLESIQQSNAELVAIAETRAELEKERAEKAERALAVSQAQYPVLEKMMVDRVNAMLGARVGAPRATAAPPGRVGRY